MSEDFLLEDEDLYQQPEDDDLRETLNKHLNDTEHDKEVVHKTMHVLTDVMISTSRDYDLAMNCKCVLMEFYRRQGLNEEEEIARIDAHAHNLDEFDKFMKARNGDLNPKRISFAPDFRTSRVLGFGAFPFPIARVLAWISCQVVAGAAYQPIVL